MRRHKGNQTRRWQQEPIDHGQLPANLVNAADQYGLQVPATIRAFAQGTGSTPANDNPDTNPLALASGQISHRPGTTPPTGAARDEALTRLEQLADWAEAVRGDDRIAIAIRDSHRFQRILDFSRDDAALLSVGARANIITATSVSELQPVYREPKLASLKLNAAVQEHGPAAAASMLEQAPEQFGALRIPWRTWATYKLGSSSISLLKAADRDMTRADKIWRHIAEAAPTMPIASSLLAFETAAEKLNQALRSMPLDQIRNDISAHRLFDDLRQSAPVSALIMANQRHDFYDPHGLWQRLGLDTARQIHGDAQLTSDALTRGVDAAQVLSAAMPAPRPAQQPRRDMRR